MNILVIAVIALMLAILGFVADDQLRPLYSRNRALRVVWLGFRNSVLYTYAFLMLWMLLNLTVAEMLGGSEYLFSGAWHAYMTAVLAALIILCFRFWRQMPPAVHVGAQRLGRGADAAISMSLGVGKWALIIAAWGAAAFVAYLVFTAIADGAAALPTSQAILIGAGIIALALLSRK